MRSLLVAVIIFGSTAGALGEEAYEQTRKMLAECLAYELKATAGSKVPAEVMDRYLQQKCGYLEERDEKEFIAFFQQRIMEVETPKERVELGITLIAEMLAYHTRGGMRRTIVEAYRSAFLKKK